MSIPSTFTLNFLLQSHMEMVKTRSWSFPSMVSCSWVPGKQNQPVLTRKPVRTNRLLNQLRTRNSGTVVHLSPVLLLDQVQVRIRGRFQNQMNLLPILQTLSDPVEALQRVVPVQILLPASTHTPLTSETFRREKSKRADTFHTRAAQSRPRTSVPESRAGLFYSTPWQRNWPEPEQKRSLSRGPKVGASLPGVPLPALESHRWRL